MTPQPYFGLGPCEPLVFAFATRQTWRTNMAYEKPEIKKFEFADDIVRTSCLGPDDPFPDPEP